MVGRKYSRKKKVKYVRYQKARASHMRTFKQAIKPVSYKLRGIVSLSTNGSNVIDTGTNFTDVSFQSYCSDYTYMFSLYDEFRCRAIKMKYVPTRPYDPSGTTVYAPLYVTFDVDNTTTPSQCTGASGDKGALEYTETCKVKQLQKSWNYYTKFMKVSQVSSAENVKAGGWQDCGNPHASQGVFITNYNSGLTASTLYGNIITTWYVQFRNRR